MRLQMAMNMLQNPRKIMSHCIVFDAHYPESPLPQVCISSSIVLPLLQGLMNAPVHLHDETIFPAEKVRDIGTNVHLSAKLLSPRSPSA